ncbi:MAG: class I SAM-dependent methyltransferase [Methanosphaera sp.]|nr:class I SAM-dependent methyltransferase [Methanosphaera sp.]
MENKEVKTAFNNAADNYDTNRKEIIPHMDVYYQTAVELTKKFNNPSILDLGAGTGILTELLHQIHPRSRITLVDMSANMLDKAKNKFNNIDNFTYIEDNYLTMDFKDNYDIIISSLSIHHLNDKEKYTLYRKIYQHLNNQGVFINADEVIAPTDTLEKLYVEKETTHLLKQDLTNDEKEEILYRRTLDTPSTLKDNLTWLDDIGYENVDVIYKYYRYFVLYGQKIE